MYSGEVMEFVLAYLTSLSGRFLLALDEELVGTVTEITGVGFTREARWHITSLRDGVVISYSTEEGDLSIFFEGGQLQELFGKIGVKPYDLSVLDEEGVDALISGIVETGVMEAAIEDVWFHLDSGWEPQSLAVYGSVGLRVSDDGAVDLISGTGTTKGRVLN